MQIDRSLFPANTQVLIDLLQSSEWPHAAPQFLICANTEKDKVERAEGILNYIGENLDQKKFCDFGCGEGHVAKEVGKHTTNSTGYDIVKTGDLPWETTQEGFTLTTDYEKVKQQSPYDFILLYDVLDHAASPIEVLEKVRLLCNQDTKVIVRCHSWMSRHGSHLYQDINKAWIHLVFTEEELNLMGLKLPQMQKIYFPLGAQDEWFKRSNFKVISSDIIKCQVESFFRRPLISNRLPLEQFKGEFPEWQMSQSFNDYILKII